jgi:AraC-like DNA-binding protein
MVLHYYLPEPSFQNYACYPEWIGHYSDMPKHRVDRPSKTLKGYNLHLVFSGEGYVRVSNRTYKMTPGTGFLFGSEAVQTYGADPDNPWDIRWIHFDGKGADSLLDGYSGKEGWIFHFTNSETLSGIMDRMLAMCGPFQPDNEPRLAIFMYELLVELLHNASPWNGTTGGKDKPRILHTAEFIRIRCADKLSLADMARHAGYSEHHFSRMFHRVMGRTVTQYLNECRILTAKRMLVSSRTTIKEIASASGFRQSSYFIKMFYRSEGITPQRYREIHSFEI